MTTHEKKSALFGLFTQFIKFGIVGISNTLISLAIYYIFIFINKDLYIIGYIVGFFVSVVNAFVLNTRFVFKDRGENNKKAGVSAFIKMLSVYGFTVVLGIVLLYLLVNKIGVSEFLAPILNLVVTVPINFLLIREWALKPESKSNETDTTEVRDEG